MFKIAITGNIASGKSAVEKFLSDKNFFVFDTDKICHDLLLTLKEEVLSAFIGFDILENENISRKKLGDIVFENLNLKRKLESIVYPKLKQKILDVFEKNKNEKYIFVSIPLLFEVGWENLFDKILFVWADDEIRLKRLMKRNSLSKESAIQRMASQESQIEKEKKSDFIIRNNDDMLFLQKQVDEFIILLEDME